MGPRDVVLPAIEQDDAGGWTPGGWSLEEAFERSRNDGPVRMSPTLLSPGTDEIVRRRKAQEEQDRIEREQALRTPTYQQRQRGLERVTPPGLDIPLMPGAGGRSGPAARGGSAVSVRPAIDDPGMPDFSGVRSGANTPPAIELFDGGSRRVDYPDGRREWISDPHKGIDGTDYGRASITAKPGASGLRGADFLKSGSALLSSPQRFAPGPPAIETVRVDPLPARVRYDATGNRVRLAGGVDQSAGHYAEVGGGSDWRQEMALEAQRNAAGDQRRAAGLADVEAQAKEAELHRAIDDPYALQRLQVGFGREKLEREADAILGRDHRQALISMLSDARAADMKIILNPDLTPAEKVAAREELRRLVKADARIASRVYEAQGRQ